MIITLANQEYEEEDANVGKGAFGRVKKYRHVSTGKVLAIKEIHESVLVQHNMVKQLEKEVELQQALHHPHVIHMYFHHVKNDCHYLGMEYASRGSLFERIRKDGPYPPTVAIFVLRCLLSALVECHARNFIHRDVKPENILFAEDDTPKLADFGWAARIDDPHLLTSVSSASPRHTFCGTLQYLSPEVVTGEPQDHKVDTWGAGLVFYEMITGIPPFASKSRADVFQHILNVDLAFPEHVTKPTKDFLMKLLHPTSEGRLSCREALDDAYLNSCRIPEWIASPVINRSATSVILAPKEEKQENNTGKFIHAIRASLSGEREENIDMQHLTFEEQDVISSILNLQEAQDKLSEEQEKIWAAAARIGLQKLLCFCKDEEESHYCLMQIREFISHLIFIASLKFKNEGTGQLTIPEVPITTAEWESPPITTKKKKNKKFYLF